MNSFLYLFNGTGWGDHFLAIPFIKSHVKKYGRDSIMIATYEDHIEKIFRNVVGRYIGLAAPDFCFKRLEKEILDFKPNRFICFNAFNGYDFDCHVQQNFKSVKYYGTYTPEGLSIRHSYKDFAHTRDQYFLLPGEKLDYTLKDRHFAFSLSEERAYKGHFSKVLNAIDLNKAIVVHLDSEQRKLWDPKSWYLAMQRLINLGMRIVIVGSNKAMISPYLQYLPQAVYLEESDIRKIFWFVKECKHFIGIDSIFAHVADAYELKGIVLFSDYPAHEWKPVSSTIDVLYPKSGNLTKDIPLEEALNLINKKFI